MSCRRWTVKGNEDNAGRGRVVVLGRRVNELGRRQPATRRLQREGNGTLSSWRSVIVHEELNSTQGRRDAQED